MLRLCGSDSRPRRGGVNWGTIPGNGISCFAYHVVLCLVTWEFTEFGTNFARNSCEIRAQLTSSLHTQPSRKDAGLDPCEHKRNGGSAAVVHQGQVILVCSTLGNIFVEFLGT